MFKRNYFVAAQYKNTEGEVYHFAGIYTAVSWFSWGINMGLIQQFVASNGKGEIVPEVVSVTSLNRI